MVLISHRGNTNGRFESYENEPMYIDRAISQNFDVEVDIWYQDNGIYLGHDKPQYRVDFKWFKSIVSNLWVHCKNLEALTYFKNCGYDVNYFWHNTDVVTLTSKGYIWAYPGNQPIPNSIAVLPELNNDDISSCTGICSDYIIKYKNQYDK